MQNSNTSSSSGMGLQNALSSPHVPSSSVKLNDFRRVKRTEDIVPYPIPGLAADILHMKVKEGSKIRNLLRFATTRMQGEGKGSTGTSTRQVVFTGSGRGVTKTITCVEILKRKLGGLHQLSKLYYKTVNEVYEGTEQGKTGSVTMQRTLPAICILLSKDPLDPHEPGYQSPQTLSIPKEDVESCRASLRAVHGSSLQHTAKKPRLDDWKACSSQTSKDLNTACKISEN